MGRQAISAIRSEDSSPCRRVGLTFCCTAIWRSDACFLHRPVRIQSHPTANGVSDTIRGCQAHMISVPSVFEEAEVIQNMEKAIVQEWFSGYIDKQLSRLSMGRLLGSLQNRFQQGIANDPSAAKIGLYACHDTTLAGVLKVLNCFDDRWPFFTAFLSFELLRKQQSSSPLGWIMEKIGSKPGEEHYVRVKYNTKDMRLPACAPVGKHLEGSNGSVCTCEKRLSTPHMLSAADFRFA